MTKKQLGDDYPSTHKRCMECGKIMKWTDNCECLRRIGREIKRKAKELWGEEIRRRVLQRKVQKEDNAARGLFDDM